MQEIVLITGASRGIGAATARLAARRGYAVCINYRDRRKPAERLTNEINDAGGRAICVAADVSREAEVQRLFETIDTQLGRLTALVNNAAFLCAREAIRRMSRKHGGTGGAIVNVSSMAARLGSPHEYIDYAASKGALDTMTTGLSREVAAEGIRVNAVRPGLIDTEMHASGGEPGRIERLKGSTPMQRGGTAEEVAHAILWLLSDEASYTTGAFIDVAGGR